MSGGALEIGAFAHFSGVNSPEIVTNCLLGITEYGAGKCCTWFHELDSLVLARACHMLQPLGICQDYGSSGVGQDFDHLPMEFWSLEPVPGETLPYLILATPREALVLGHNTQ